MREGFFFPAVAFVGVRLASYHLETYQLLFFQTLIIIFLRRRVLIIQCQEKSLWNDVSEWDSSRDFGFSFYFRCFTVRFSAKHNRSFQTRWVISSETDKAINGLSQVYILVTSFENGPFGPLLLKEADTESLQFQRLKAEGWRKSATCPPVACGCGDRSGASWKPASEKEKRRSVF